MNKIEHSLSKKTIKKWVLLLSVILLMFNVMLILLINIQYRNELKREYQSLSELVSHLAYYEDHDVIISYLEHYEHTQDVTVIFHNRLHEVIYQSENIDLTMNPLVYNDVIVGYLGVNFTTSLLGQDYVISFLMMNGLMMIILSSLLFIFYQHMQKYTNLWVNELAKMDDDDYPFQIEDIKEAHLMFKDAIDREKASQQTYEMHIKRIAHDIKTPLTSSLILLEGMKTKRLPSDENVITDVMDELHHIDQLLPQFISQSSQEIALDQDVSSLVLDTIKRYQDVFLTKDIQFTLQLEPLKTHISKIDFITILEHLIFNAFYYTNPHKTISISTLSQDKKLIIKDEGIGMSEDDIKQLMSGRFRGDKAQTYHQKGSGMGYMIILDLLKKYNADIRIESELYKGTSVTITFK